MTAGGSVVGSKGVGPAGVGPADVGRSEIARYYDRNTGRFLLMGRGGVYGIHRELWGPGVITAGEAADHVNRMIAAELADLAASPDALVLDFGCGVGGTLFRLAQSLPGARFHGVTVSRRQHEIAERLAERLGRSSRCSFTHGDFHSVEMLVDLGRAVDAVVAVESFAHSDAPAAFLSNATRHLARGGRLVVVDDFLARDEGALDPDERSLVAGLRRGWRVPGLATAERLEREAEEHGLAVERAVNLTPLTRPGGRLRDRVVAAVAPALVGLDPGLGLSRMPFFGNLIGGHALQDGLRRGFLEYRLLVFRKIA